MSSTHVPTVSVEELDDRVVLRLERPAARNAINNDMVEDLHSVCRSLESDPRILLLTGSDGIFAAGADIRVGTESVRFANPEPSLGIVAAAGATWRLLDLIGEPVAKEVLLGGRVLDATEAHALRLLNEIVAPDDLLAAGHRWADRIARQPPLAVRLTKTAIHALPGAHPVIDGLAQAILFETEEKADRMTRALDKRVVQ